MHFRVLPALILCAGAMALSPAAAGAQVPCIPGVPIPGCTPPAPQPPPSGGGGGGGSAPPATGPTTPGGSAPPPPPRPAEPPGCAVARNRGSDFVGIVTEDVFVGGPSYRRCTLSRQVDHGIGLIRQTFSWSDMESPSGAYSFAYYDGYVRAAAEHRIRVLPILFGAPAHRARPGRRRGSYPPKQPAAMGRWAAALVKRYGPRGSFWKENRGVPKIPIRSWQVWNEPNLEVYWPTGPSAREYVRLLRAVNSAIKRVDRGAEVVTAGLPDSKHGIALATYIKQMYRAGARSAFDTLAVNAYSSTAGGVLAKVRGTRKLMNSFRDRGARIWVTEVGWASDGPGGGFTAGFKGQASRIKSTLAGLYRERRRLRVRGIVYYNWQDAPPYAGGKDFWGLHTGLLDLQGKPKPALTSFRAAARKIR